jgi:uncharacterized protein (DUF885 family)
MPTQPIQSSSVIGEALRIADDAWEELRRRPFVQQQLRSIPAQLADVSIGEAQRRSAVGSSLLKRLDAIDPSTLPHELALTLRLVRFRAEIWSRQAEWYWIAVDPLGVELFGLFLPTAYCGGSLLNVVNSQLASFPFMELRDADRYLALIDDYGRIVDQCTTRTAGQAERGIRMPKVQVHQARTLLAAFKSRVRAMIGVDSRRLVTLSRSDFAGELEDRITTRVEPAFDRALEGLSDEYLREAPEAVGLAQYPGGAETYAELVKLHTTLTLTPEEIHVRGHARVADIEQQMGAISHQAGFGGDTAAFLAQLNTDMCWRANTVEGVAAVFQRYIDRVKPRLQEYFSVLPKLPCTVGPLPPELQGSMTYGYYDPPKEDQPQGRYLFNAGILTTQPLFTLGTLTYHELMPGHHLHLTTQQENDALHPFRKYSLVTAYNEGWAEYAATFAGEIGLYETPAERYGRLVMDAFLTCRLVVDTGMNALGWSLERAREYMRKHSGMTEAEILTESVRYSCDIPGQALAYKLGDTKILELREKMAHTLGTRFELKQFHSTVLDAGALPLPELEWHVEHEVERLAALSNA